MSALLPGFADQLAVRAETLAAEHVGAATRGRFRRTGGWLDGTASAKRIRRPHLPRGRTLGLSILVVGALSGAAYAAQGLWQPVIGSTAFHRQAGRATASALPADQLAMLGVLRRPQTAADRGAASRYALAFQGGDVIRTNEVRLLATLPGGSAAVLIPVAKRADGHLLDFMNPSAAKRDVLCLWIRDPVDGGGQSCSSTGQVASGMLTGGIGRRAPLTAKQQAASDAAMRRAQAAAMRSHASYVRFGLPLDHETITTVGVVPDGVAFVRMGHRRGAPVLPVHGNVFITTRRIVPADDQIWLDAHLQVIPRLRTSTIRALTNWPPTKHPGLVQRSFEAAIASSNRDRSRRADQRNLANINGELATMRRRGVKTTSAMYRNTLRAQKVALRALGR